MRATSATASEREPGGDRQHRPAPRHDEEERAERGPAKRPTLSTPLASTFAAVSSSGVRTSDGVNATCAERNSGSATAASTASA